MPNIESNRPRIMLKMQYDGIRDWLKNSIAVYISFCERKAYKKLYADVNNKVINERIVTVMNIVEFFFLRFKSTEAGSQPIR